MAWASVTEADAYFADSLELAKWDAITNKSGAINSAYRVLLTHPAYSYPSTVTDNMKNANIEYALYLASVGTKRQDLINQGVTQFKVGDFSETLKEQDEWHGSEVTLPSIVKQYLKEYSNSANIIGFISRDSTD